jgi:glucose-6-phosphate isomerase
VPKQEDEKFQDLGLNYLEGLSFNNLLNQQADATIKSVEEQKDIPCDVVTISTVDEYNMAKLMFSYQLLVSAIGQFLQINTYDQPGVESGKIILKESLENSL